MGYDVRVITFPKYDIRQWRYDYRLNDLDFPIYGILAAPPCTMFSLARTTAKTPRDLDKGMETVRACMDIIWEARLKTKLAFWAMENPKGLLRQFMGVPSFTFDASEFGEDYNKATDLWGYFSKPVAKRNYTRFPSTDKNTRKLPAIPEDYIIDSTMSRTAIRRSITPQTFAWSFFWANQ